MQWLHGCFKSDAAQQRRHYGGKSVWNQHTYFQWSGSEKGVFPRIKWLAGKASKISTGFLFFFFLKIQYYAMTLLELLTPANDIQLMSQALLFHHPHIHMHTYHRKTRIHRKVRQRNEGERWNQHICFTIILHWHQNLTFSYHLYHNKYT